MLKNLSAVIPSVTQANHLNCPHDIMHFQVEK